MNGIPNTCHPGLLGAHWDPQKGTSFRVYTDGGAFGVKLLLFPDGNSSEHEVIEMRTENAFRPHEPNEWNAFVPHAVPGQHYAFRVSGWWNPREGYRHDESKVLVDPAGRLLSSRFEQHPSLFSRVEAGTGKLVWEDSLPYAPRSVIGNPCDFDWGTDQPLGLKLPLGDVVFWEAPIRGATIKMKLSAATPGTYSAIASDEMIAHLRRHGFTVVELYVPQQSLPGYCGDWNYNPICFGAPDWRYATNPSDPLSVEREFKRMVKRLHEAGILVCIDAVYNHTLEGNECGPTLSLKGLDNFCYRLCGAQTGAKEFYENWSGCGNAVNLHHPPALRLAVETLERWVCEFHVDMIRFDLLGTMLGDNWGFDPSHPLLCAINSHPMLSRVVKTGEPWSAHDAGRYRVPVLGKGWSMWNDCCRDTLREFWLGAGSTLGNFVSVLTGCRCWYPPDRFGNYPVVSGMFFHDGFNMAQWLMHNGKSNGDGHSDNHSWNCGEEGIPKDPALAGSVQALRLRIWKAAYATLAFSPMALVRAGDEVLNYPGSANNNIYNAGDEANGIDWNANPEFAEYTCAVMALRHRFYNLGRMIFVPAGLKPGGKHPFGCYDYSGQFMVPAAWERSEEREVMLYLPGCPAVEDEPPAPADSSNLLVIFNSSQRPMRMTIPLPAYEPGRQWVAYLRTGHDDPFAREVVQGGWFEMDARSMALLVSEVFEPAA
jgi:isoamylase